MWQAHAREAGELVELTVIVAGLLLAVGGFVVLIGLVLARAATRLTTELAGWLRRLTGHGRGRRIGGLGPDETCTDQNSTQGL
jgi:hypothetical protein